MIRVILIAACAIFLLLSCKSKQAVVKESESTALIIDTTQVIINGSVQKITTVDTTKSSGAFESDRILEFVDGGGKVIIDTIGNVTIDGLKSVKGKYRGHVNKDNGITQSGECSEIHTEQSNGITEDQTDKFTTEETRQTEHWYDSVFVRIGQGVCIAFLLWLLFLYLKRKR